ncbi:carbohydrate sulfotransferase 11-like [Macrobrachium rosenbergii]|uniref:carbohydrate sulfotransferase 11-like n=1 Tax=Macrobrachium rosenbergii TaxID=79674 RepID=UPI0034D63078
MLTLLKNSYSAANRILNRRLAPGIWVICLLALFTISHLALLNVERTRDLRAIGRENSTLQRLFQKLMISDRSLCGGACASTDTSSPKSPPDVNSITGDNGEGDKSRRESGEGDKNKGEHDEEIILPEREQVMHPEQYQKDVARKLSSAWTEETAASLKEVFNKRAAYVKDVCSSMKITGALSPKMNQVFENMRYIMKHNMIWCPVFKAASTTWVKNLLLIAGETKIAQKSLHARVRQLFGQPEDPTVRDKVVQEFQKMLIVRHPLERLLSAYRDKMLRVRNEHDPHVKIQQEILRLYPDPKSPTPKPTKGPRNKVLGHPTFTQFLMKVRDDLLKAWSSDGKFLVNMHWRPVWLTCAPCQVPYDYIAKMESLDLEQEYIIRQMGLQDLLYNAHTHSSNFDSYNTTSEAVKEYFRQVPRRLLRDVVELYQLDFTLFDYSPDLYLELAIREE